MWVVLPDRIQAAAASAPVLVVQRTEIDAGEVVRGESLRLAFEVKNAGQALLVVNPRPTCGCTVVNCDKQIAPGKSGKVNVELRTQGLQGHLQKTLVLQSNDPKRREVSLAMRFKAVPLLDIQPEPGTLVALRDKGPTTADFRLTVRGRQPAEITTAVCNVPYATTALEASRDPGAVGRAYRLRLTIDETAPRGRQTLTVLLRTTSPHEPEIVLPVACEKGITVAPSMVLFGRVGAETPLPVCRTVLVRRSEGAFRILKAESSDAAVEVREEGDAAGPIHRLTLSYRGGAKAGLGQGKIILQTDDPAQPSLEIKTIYVAAGPSPEATASAARESPRLGGIARQ